ncbi:MAG: nicotinate (nicotinamide) nucleotide adenylyltransferase [Deltaproteobacteria bacterium]|nr:nicotinate (nicotinamide) nucleotide adenylyltransferase [Deltaproteobacteria bacterium]MBW2362989.1 nicotinate (nicotinamide) nucleotide adenylyltransferase [Deltaproteobacteria bacterium]
MSVGVFGGTFDPIHWGHLRAAEEVAEQLELESVLFVPSASPPHKTSSDIAPAELRLAWVRDAIADNPHFAVDPLEVERGGHSYSYETLQEIGARLASELPVFVIGCDAFCEIDEWREPETLLRLAHFAVMTRPPADRGTLRDWLPRPLAGAIEFAPDGRSGRHREVGTKLDLVEISALDVSSSDVRRRLREGRSLRYLLPEAIRSKVEQSGVYAPA